jgi:hypothetical protein
MSWAKEHGQRLTALEVWRPSFDVGGDPLHVVFCRPQTIGEGSDVFVEGSPFHGETANHDPFDGPLRQWSAPRELFDHGFDGRDQLVGRHHARHQADPVGFRGVDELTRPAPLTAAITGFSQPTISVSSGLWA